MIRSALQPRRMPQLAMLALAGLLAAPVLHTASAAPVGRAAAAKPAHATPAPIDETRIMAVVNGDVITNVDVNNRARLFAMSTGLPMSQKVLNRLKPQILRQLIDERLRMQEIERRHIVIADKRIAKAIRQIEARNGMPAGALRARLEKAGASPVTLIDQVRTELGWLEVLHQQLGPRGDITDAEVAARQRLLHQDVGKPEYRVGEIFVAVDNPSNRADAERFAQTVITELRAGAPFPLVAAQFSQAQSALEGGELGWVQPNQLDPAVAKLVGEMPVGAISNPVPVPGGLTIVALQGKRDIGRDMETVLSLRQVFLPFTSPLDPRNPTAQQRATLIKARHIITTVHGCAQMEQVAKEDHSPRPADPGQIRLAHVTPPAFRDMLAKLPIGRPSQPLVASDGIAVMVVCSRERKNLAAQTKQEVRRQILEQRVELASRQLQQQLRQRAEIDIRQSGA